MGIELTHSPVTGSRNTLRPGPSINRPARNFKKFTEKEIAGIRAFYLTEPTLPAAIPSAGHSKTAPKSKNCAAKSNSRTTKARTAKVSKVV